MRGYFISFLSVGGVLLFSVCMFLGDSLSMFWLFLELGTLSLVPSFFLVVHDKVLQSLFSYLVVSSVSSSFLVCGFLFEDLLFMCVVGLCIKFGLFPFMGWVYKVVEGSNWLVVWGFSTFLKSPFLVIPFFLKGGTSLFLGCLCSLTLVFLSVVFWVYTYNWFHCWCHMMISSSVSLVAMSIALSSWVLVSLFVVYVIWSSLVIFFLSGLSKEGLVLEGVASFFLYVGLLVAYPLSLSIFYKLIMGVSIFSCAFLVFVSWVVYSVSEQFFLLKSVVSLSSPRWVYGVSSVV